jgi:hypothetical protein
LPGAGWRARRGVSLRLIAGAVRGSDGGRLSAPLPSSRASRRCSALSRHRRSHRTRSRRQPLPRP